MKISKLHKLAWGFFALVLSTTTVVAQGRGYRNQCQNVNISQTNNGNQFRNGRVNNRGNNCTQLSFNEDLSKSEIEGLQLMQEEEKMAHDVYVYFQSKYELPVFSNISKSEERHSNAILNLINGYELEDLATNKEGEYNNKKIQKLYTQLIQKGERSLTDALSSAAFVEEQDIADLQRLVAETTNQDVKLVYSNLLRASEVHLRRFVNMLENQGVAYHPEVLSPKAYQSITQVNSGNGNNNLAFRGNRNRRNNASFQRGSGRGNGRGNGCQNFRQSINKI